MLSILALVVSLVVASGQLLHFPGPPRVPVESQRPHGPFEPVDPESHTEYRPAPPVENDVELVIVGVTSGNRNPDVFLRDDPNRDRWGVEGPGQLNMFLSFSSTGESEQMTSQVVNAGVFPPDTDSVIEPSLAWQPVPVTTDDTLMGITRVTRCPSVKHVMEPIFNGEIPVVRDVLNREREVVDYVVRRTGIRRNLQDLSEVAENLHQIRIRNLVFPDWAENPRETGLDRESFYRRVQVFRHAVEVACSVYEPCKRLLSGVVVEQIKEIVQTVGKTRPVTGDRQDRIGMVVYTGDVEVILSVLRVLDLDYFDVPTTGGFVLEVRRPRDPVASQRVTTPSVRVLYHQPDINDRTTHKFYVAERVERGERRWNCPEDSCPVREFVRHVRPYAVPDYRVVCRDTQCNKLSPLDTVNEVENDVIVNPKIATKSVDCTYETDKYPETACRELARNNFCQRNGFVRNVVCRRTCHCTQVEAVENVIDYIIS